MNEDLNQNNNTLNGTNEEKPKEVFRTELSPEEASQQDNSSKTEVKNEKVTGNDYNHNISNKTSFASASVFCLGQGGGNLGEMLELSQRKHSNFENLVAINTSDDDLNALNIPSSQKFKIGSGSGIGKRREKAKEIFFSNGDEFFKKIVNLNKNILFGENKIVFTTFSSGGGTGSALGAPFTALLTQYCANLNEAYSTINPLTGKEEEVSIENYRPNVIGICSIPDYKTSIDSGIDVLENTLECMADIKKIIDRKVGSFFLVQNNINTNNNKSLYIDSDQKVVDGFVKFLRRIGTSKSNTNLDIKDRYEALSRPGLYCFTNLDLDANRYNMVLPILGSKVSSLIAEISYTPETYTSKVEQVEKFIKQFNISDITIGWNDLSLNPNADELDKEDIVLLSGFNGIDSILEPIKDCIERRTKAVNSSIVNGKAFEGLETRKIERNESRSKNTNADLSDLF